MLDTESTGGDRPEHTHQAPHSIELHARPDPKPPRHRARPHDLPRAVTPTEVVGDSKHARQVHALMVLVHEHAPHGVERSGHMWSALPQPVLLDALNERLDVGDRVKMRTLQNLVKEPGIVRVKRLVCGKTLCLLRLGEPDETAAVEAHEIAVRRMAAIWQKCREKNPKAKGRSLMPHEYGMIRGLAEAWTSETAPKIFSLVVRRWGAFMSAARCEPDWEEHVKWYKHPSLSIIRRFQHAGVVMFDTLVTEPALTRDYIDVFAESSGP